MSEPAWCPACKHERHRSHCTVRVNWLRRLFRKLDRFSYTDECSCYYWDADWEDAAISRDSVTGAK